jgi:NAD(P)-dependent dehydrogenase (short-subunit alcohol dehydrogenase family)
VPNLRFLVALRSDLEHYYGEPEVVGAVGFVAKVLQVTGWVGGVATCSLMKRIRVPVWKIYPVPTPPPLPPSRPSFTKQPTRRTSCCTSSGAEHARAIGVLEDHMRLEGKTALVTGASRGIGRATALELARRGAELILAARTVSDPVPGMPGTLFETAEGVRALGRDVQVVPADLNDMASVQNLADQALAWKGKVDVVVNNAAFLGRAAYHNLDELSFKNFERQFAVNVFAPFLLAKALVPAMRRNGGGAIVNITSSAGFIGQYTVPGITYGSTKAALNRLTTLLARDLAEDRIVVFALDPNFTRTTLVEQTSEQAGTDLSTAHPVQVPAAAIADLIQADATHTSGRVFKAADGQHPFLMADSQVPMPTGTEVDFLG